MARTISKQQAVGAFGEVLGSLSDDEETVIVDERGNRIAVVISPEEFDRFKIDRAWETVRRVQDRNADNDPDEVMKFVTEVVEEVRQEAYDKQRASSGGH